MFVSGADEWGFDDYAQDEIDGARLRRCGSLRGSFLDEQVLNEIGVIATAIRVVFPRAP